MPSGGLMQLVAYGAQDVFFYPPQIKKSKSARRRSRRRLRKLKKHKKAKSKKYNMKTFKFGKKKTRNNECSICLIEYDENCKISRLNCSHCFHTDCIKQWLDKTPKKYRTCPYCRQNTNRNKPRKKKRLNKHK